MRVLAGLLLVADGSLSDAVKAVVLLGGMLTPLEFIGGNREIVAILH